MRDFLTHLDLVEEQRRSKELPEKALELLQETGYAPFDRCYSFKTSSQFNVIERIAPKEAKYIANVKGVNDLGFINKFFECINERLELGGKYFLCAETALQRRKRLVKKHPPILNYCISGP